jgi:N,N'-diacetyllegionaminate synthase
VKRDKVFIIAEAGVNHNGNIEIAKKLIDIAIGVGANAVKFQTFKAEKVISKFAQKAEYQYKITDKNETQLEMVKRLELDVDAHKELIHYCKKKGLMFLSTPFDIESIGLLNELEVEILKIPSGEITNLPYLRKIGSLNRNIIISTGMADLEEIGKALDILLESGTSKDNITVLHCNSEYPTPFEDVNLTAMLTIRDTFRVNIGYSDHTPGIEVPIAAVALGATVIEKHFTLNKDMDGPDHKASLGPDELKSMVTAIRNIEKSLGDGIKRPSPSELKNRPLVRKSIIAGMDIKEGDMLTENNITVKRLGIGINPMEWDNVIGRKAIHDFKEDELIEI